MFYFFPGDGTDRCNWPKSRPGKKGVFSILRASKLNGFSPNALRMLGRFVTLYRKLDFLTAEPGMVNEKRCTPIRVRVAAMLGDERAAAIHVDLAWSRLNNDIWHTGVILGALNRSFHDSPE